MTEIRNLRKLGSLGSLVEPGVSLSPSHARAQIFARRVCSHGRWGNSENDTTSAGNRILGSENGPVLDLCLMVLKIIREFEKNNFKLEK